MPEVRKQESHGFSASDALYPVSLRFLSVSMYLPGFR